MTNSTVSGNISTTGDGGGIVNYNGTMHLVNSTIANNTATSGGGLYNAGGTMTYKNTIVSSNTGGNCLIGFGSNTSQGYNIEDTDTCNFNQTGDQVNTNPLINALGPNGGVTLTHSLQTGSPAINNGTGTGAPTIDQRGYNRIGVPDVGAYEYSAGLDETLVVTATVPSTLTFTVAGVSAGVVCANAGGNASVTSTGSTMPFGTYGGAQTKIVCQTLTVSTNATDGYVITVEQNQDLTSGGSDTMKTFSGTYAIPTIWASPPGSGTESYFGFTTDDTDYSDFQVSKYGSFGGNNTPYNIAMETEPVADEVNVVSYQLEVTVLQETGVYTNNIMYIATAVF
ncbi:hypothetical protein KJ855_02650 [Patescibacteria group bacterium]|nr:hypothetical protein [Patescibacteria group bacterium]